MIPCLVHAHFRLFSRTSNILRNFWFSHIFFPILFLYTLFLLFLYHPKMPCLNLLCIVPFCSSALKTAVVKSHIHLGFIFNFSRDFEPLQLWSYLNDFNKAIHIWRCAKWFISVALRSCSSSSLPLDRVPSQQSQEGYNQPKKKTPDPGECERMEFYECVPHGECCWDFGYYLHFN